MKFSRIELQKYGFNGFVKIGQVKKDFDGIPREKGVYLIFRSSLTKPIFRRKSTGGWFKKRNPTVKTEILEKKWVDNAQVLYIGQTSNQTLYKRIRQYLLFSKGEPVAHWGGRYMWQLKAQDSLLIAWKSIKNKDPRLIETSLIRKFKERFRKTPFANIRE